MIIAFLDFSSFIGFLFWYDVTVDHSEHLHFIFVYILYKNSLSFNHSFSSCPMFCLVSNYIFMQHFVLYSLHIVCPYLQRLCIVPTRQGYSFKGTRHTDFWMFGQSHDSLVSVARDRTVVVCSQAISHKRCQHL